MKVFRSAARAYRLFERTVFQLRQELLGIVFPEFPADWIEDPSGFDPEDEDLDPEDLITPATVPLPVFRSDLSFGAEPVRISLLFLILCGLATSVMWGAIFSLATSGLGVYTAAASGIFMTMVCGGGIMSALQAWIADQSSYPISYALVAVGFAYLLFYALHGSRTEHDMPAGIPDK